MFQKLSFPKDLTDQETRKIAEPAAYAILFLCTLTAIYGFTDFIDNSEKVTVIALGLLGSLYSAGGIIWILRSPRKVQNYKWILVTINTLMAVLGLLLEPPELRIIIYIAITLATIIKTVLWGRIVAYVFLISVVVGHIAIFLPINRYLDFLHRLDHYVVFMLTIVIVELIQRLTDANMNQIKRLQLVNDFVRQLSLSLKAEQVLTIVGAAIQKAIEADTYFVGLLTEQDSIYFHLLYDDGQFFPPTEYPLDGTLSGWVIRNQRSLFIPDLRTNINLEGVKVILTGNNRDNACWMGVPMRASSINGLIAVASYQPYAFDRTALELLENLAQHAALALDNAYRHAEVEAQSRLDSLTGVYNHGHIIEILRKEMEMAQVSGTTLSLIMLDIDYFKQYNDNYGHQVGDEVLIRLTQEIRKHIKSSDALGRWGGEEFTIVVPGANGVQALQIAQRVRETVNMLSIRTHSEKTLPFPTVSQGIAVFPSEATSVDQLIHLADQRLYVAKEHGRNQTEPGEEHWKKIIN